MTDTARPGQLRTVISADQIQKRVREMGRQISDDYRGQSIHLLALLENGFIFMADLVRAFLMSDLRARGAASVKLATLLDRQSARRVQLQPDYFGFLVDDAFLVGYGLGSPEQTNRNLPYIGAAS